MDDKQYPWFKMHSKGWLTGTIRANLEIEERSVWADLLAMANESRVRGVICRAVGIPYDRGYIANYLDIPLELLNRTIAKCQCDVNMRDELHRIELDKDGCLIITNWDRYQAVPDGKAKKEYKEQSKARARDRQNSLDGLRREVNRLNMNITEVGKKLRYVERDGEILDTETGEIVPSPEGGEK